MTFGANNYVTAFGLWFRGGSGYGPDGSGLGPEWTITVTETNGDTFVIHEDILLPFTYDYDQLSRYYGFESDIGIKEISFFDDPSVRGAGNLFFDNVSRSLIQSSVPDLNMDGFIDGLDLGILLGNFDQNGIPASGGELNGTDPVDGLDLGIMLGAWNPPSRSPAATIPEPSTIPLAMLGTAGGCCYRRRR